jgi:dTDP-4-amino-4,6-dideoxygalactose transaminase
MKDSAKWSYSGNTLETIKIPFHVPLVTGSEQTFVLDAIQHKYLASDGSYSVKCSSHLENLTGSKKVLMTSSCTDALEMAAILANIREGDEVIMTSFNFVSAANAFVLRGAKICFVDIEPHHMNIDVEKIGAAVTPKTKVIVVMHYGGIPCDMDAIMGIAEKFNLLVVEDAAHCIGSYYKGKHLGSIGHLGTLSFHESKNIQCGEGGALLINEDSLIQRATVIKDKGTDRSDFFKGTVKKYTWVDIGSSYGLGELHAAFLYGQLLDLENINAKRVRLWQAYQDLFSQSAFIETCTNPGNGHIFYVKTKNATERERLMSRLKTRGISAVSHYEPLHTSKAGQMYADFIGRDVFTSSDSQRLLRLPMYYDLTFAEIEYIYEGFVRSYES